MMQIFGCPWIPSLRQIQPTHINKRHVNRQFVISTAQMVGICCFAITVGSLGLDSTHAQAPASDQATQVAETAAPPIDKLDSELTLEWTEKILPVLDKHCGECHLRGANEAGVNLGD